MMTRDFIDQIAKMAKQRAAYRGALGTARITLVAVREYLKAEHLAPSEIDKAIAEIDAALAEGEKKAAKV